MGNAKKYKIQVELEIEHICEKHKYRNSFSSNLCVFYHFSGNAAGEEEK